jgi:hypothetical protein
MDVNAHGWAVQELKSGTPDVGKAQAWAILALAEAVNNLTFTGSCDVSPIAQAIEDLGREFANLTSDSHPLHVSVS